MTQAATPSSPPPPPPPPPPPGRPSPRFDRSIVEGPIGKAVWKLAWPTMLQNIIGGMQGVVDHVMVGHFVGYAGNAAVGVAFQIFLVVVVLITSLFTGMSILVARFAGAGDAERVNRTVYQAFLTAALLSVGIMAPLGYFLAPSLLALVHATDAVRAEALPYLRIMFVFSFGMMNFFMLGCALRSAGDARTPLRLGVALTLLNITLNVILISGAGPIPAYGTAGAAMGTVLAGGIVAAYAIYHLFKGDWVVSFHRGDGWKPDFHIIRALFRFGLPTGFQGVAMNIGGVILLRFIGSLPASGQAQAAYAIGYTELFSFITWTSVGLMGATATIAGQNLGAGQPERAIQGVHTASRIGLSVAAGVGFFFVAIPQALLGLFGATEPDVATIGRQLLQYLAVSGFFITLALTYTGALQGTGDTRSPLVITLASQVAVPIGLCLAIQSLRPLVPGDIWLAIVLGHFSRAVLTVLRFRQGKWRNITVK